MFGQQVPTALVDAVLRNEVNLAGTRAEATVLMSDIRGFTAIGDSLEPPVLIALLNRYFEAMVTSIEEFGGTLHKFIGDAVLVHFNVPLPQPDHALLAIRTALRMRERLAAFNEDQVARGEPTLRIGMGINTGDVIAGHIGAEGRKSEYAIMGEAVNIASRLESETKEVKTDILISGATFERVRDHIDVAGPTEMSVKGMPAPVQVYSVVGLKRA